MGYAAFSNLTSMSAVLDSIDSFLVTTEGWTQDQAPPGGGAVSAYAAWNSGDCFIQAEFHQYGTSIDETFIRFSQSTDYAGRLDNSVQGDGNDPAGTQGTNATAVFQNSGVWCRDQSNLNQTVTDGRLYCFGPGSGVAATEKYAHFVLEPKSNGIYHHFGFGHAKPYGTGYGTCAYKYGSGYAGWDSSETNPMQSATHLFNYFGLGNDRTNANTSSLYRPSYTYHVAATMRLENGPGQPAGGRYLWFDSAALARPNDGGGFAVGKGFMPYYNHQLLTIRGNPNNAFIPLVPIEQWYLVSLPSEMYPISELRDVFYCNIGNINPAQEITLGSDTYAFFPVTSKYRATSTSEYGTRNCGVAYKKL